MNSQRALLVALLALLIAACTGILLRFGLVMGMPAWAQNYTAIRHAHSHLMYFGWATLALMALIWRFLPTLTERTLPRAVAWQMGASAMLALLSFPAFWANGYGLTTIGPATLPLGSMAAGLNGLVWLFFAALYYRATWRLPVRPLPIQLWDWALILLLLAFGGALGLVGVVITGASHPLWQQLSLHLFLDLFGVGWFNLALLGVLWAWLGASHPRWLPTQSLALLLAPTFLLGTAPSLIPTDLFWIAALANAGVACLLGWHLIAFWQRRQYFSALGRFALMILGVHIATAFVILWPGLWQWSAGTQLRIFFLHNFLLGWVSSALLALILAAARQWSKRLFFIITWLWIGGVATMLLALLSVGLVQFLPIRAVDGLWLAAWSSVSVAMAAGLGLLILGRLASIE
ncbi:MAG: hypothetical protein R3C14_42685 [Caldilineaceae bacterium]